MEEDQKGSTPCRGKSVPRKQEGTSMPQKRKSTGKKAKESGRERSSVPYEGKGTARGVEKKFMGDIEEEG